LEGFLGRQSRQYFRRLGIGVLQVEQEPSGFRFGIEMLFTFAAHDLEQYFLGSDFTATMNSSEHSGFKHLLLIIEDFRDA
jgi:hypothetical protein